MLHNYKNVHQVRIVQDSEPKRSRSLPRIFVNPGPGKYNHEPTFNEQGRFKDSRIKDLTS